MPDPTIADIKAQLLTQGLITDPDQSSALTRYADPAPDHVRITLDFPPKTWALIVILGKQYGYAMTPEPNGDCVTGAGSVYSAGLAALDRERLTQIPNLGLSYRSVAIGSFLIGLLLMIAILVAVQIEADRAVSWIAIGGVLLTLSALVYLWAKYSHAGQGK